jgi:hypothetical protein
MTDHTKKVCDLAREYVDRGWNVFPLSINTRRPLNEWKTYQTEFVHPDEIDDWEDQGAPYKNPNNAGHTKPFNLALVTGKISGVVVVDCDNKEAVDFAKRNGLTSPIAVKTTRGMHYYFKHPGGGIELRNKVGTNPGYNWYSVPGLDFRGDGGYVVAPPSIKIGGNIHEVVHEYHFVIPEGFDFDDMPTWPGTPDHLDTSQDFSFENLDLSTTRVIDNQSLDVREQVKQYCALVGRKLHGPDKGDGTDNWMIKFCGQQVRKGIVGDDLAKAVEEFFNEFFDYDAPQQETVRWLNTKMRSAMEMDRRNHPEDYDIHGERINKNKTPDDLEKAKFTPVFAKDINRLLESLGNVEYWAEPLIPCGSIVQVIGYNGHGKSFFLTSMLMSMCAGNDHFGPFKFGQKRPKVFYLDFDNPARTALTRMSRMASQFGSPEENFALWSAAIIPPELGGDINLNTDLGVNVLLKWVEQEEPDIVVIDTVRNAFGGFDENSAQDWFKVNHIAKLLRDQFKCTVILVHHRNKPGDGGLGREAGSTAQLTNIDTQIVVTQVYTKEDLAKKKAGIWSEKCHVEMPDALGGGSYPVDLYLNDMAKKAGRGDFHFKMISEISYGKVRQITELHDTQYIGYGEDLIDSYPFIEYSRSKRQMAEFLHKTGKAPVEISRALMIPKVEIEKWLS